MRKCHILEVIDGSPELMKYISEDELCALCEVFDNALTGSGGKISAGVKAILFELGVEICPESEIEVIQQPQQPGEIATCTRGTHCGHH